MKKSKSVCVCAATGSGVWEVCGGRKAPLVASDSSSSGGSDSEEEGEEARSGDKTAAKR